MKKYFLCGLMSIGLTAGVGIAHAQTAAPAPIVKLDPALDELVAPDAKLEVLKADAYQAAEGPLWVPQGKSGYLLFSDVILNVVERFDPGCDKAPCPVESGKSSVFLEHVGFSDAENAAGKISHPEHDGTVGLELDPQGRLVMVAYGDHAVIRVEKDGTRTILANTFEGKRFSCPNKLAIKADGTIYFTDALTACVGGEKSAERELDFHGLFSVKDGKVAVLAKDPEGGAPHGIVMSPDEKILYVGIGKKILAYDVQPDDSLTNERVFLDVGDAQGGIDGVNVDGKGNLWLAGPGGIWIVNPQGKHIGTIPVPMAQGVRFANVAFGDNDRKTLYIVGNKNLWRVRLKVAGTMSKTHNSGD